jgi:hypothetical protein
VTNNYFSFIVILIFGILTVSYLVDQVLWITWDKKYFTTGLSILTLRVSTEHRHNNIPNKSRLEAHFRSAWGNSLRFKELDSNIYGFRDDFFWFRPLRYPPIMHGMLLFDYDNNQVVVKGLVNWSVFYFPLVALGWAILNTKSLMAFLIFMCCFAVISVSLFAILYLVQFSRFSDVATLAAQEWSKEHFQEFVRA